MKSLSVRVFVILSVGTFACALCTGEDIDNPQRENGKGNAVNGEVLTGEFLSTLQHALHSGTSRQQIINTENARGVIDANEVLTDLMSKRLSTNDLSKALSQIKMFNDVFPVLSALKTFENNSIMAAKTQAFLMRIEDLIDHDIEETKVRLITAHANDEMATTERIALIKENLNKWNQYLEFQNALMRTKQMVLWRMAPALPVDSTNMTGKTSEL